VSEARDILEAMGRAYAACRSYRDVGVVTHRVEHPYRDEHVIVTQTFSTSFVRPGRFRFEFRSTFLPTLTRAPVRHVVWASDHDVRTWWDLRPEVKRPRSLSMAVGGATGISMGSAHTVPAMLMAEIGGRRLSRLRAASVERLLVDGVACIRIGLVNDRTEIEIDATTLLLRRIYEPRIETLYDAQIDVDIDEDALAFAQPSEPVRLGRTN